MPAAAIESNRWRSSRIIEHAAMTMKRAAVIHVHSLLILPNTVIAINSHAYVHAPLPRSLLEGDLNRSDAKGNHSA